MRRLALVCLALLLLGGVARASYLGGGSTFGVTNVTSILSTTFVTATTVLTGDTVVATTSMSVGATPTAITRLKVYTPSLTPAASSAAIQTVTEEFTVAGITTADKVVVNGPAPTSLCPMVSARASDTDKIKLDFVVLTAAACTPAAGTYTILAIRS